MKQLLLLTFLTGVLLISCKENKSTTNNKAEVEATEFKEVEPSVIAELNKNMATKEIKSEEEVLNNYRPKSTETEGNYTYTVTQKTIDGNTKELTLVEENMLDDSQAGQKTIMTIKQENNQFSVISIKESYKCQTERGHTDWGPALCK